MTSSSMISEAITNNQTYKIIIEYMLFGLRNFGAFPCLALGAQISLPPLLIFDFF